MEWVKKFNLLYQSQMESKKLFKDLEEKQNKVLLQRRTVSLKETREKVEWLKQNSSLNGRIKKVD